MGEDIACRCLAHIFTELPGICAQSLPFSGILIDPHESYLAVVFNSRRGVAEISPGGQHYPEPCAVSADLVTAARVGLPWVVDRRPAAIFDILPVRRGVRVRFAPQALKAVA